MFLEEKPSTIDPRQKKLEDDFKELLESLMRAYLDETRAHLPDLDAELGRVSKTDVFGNVTAPESKRDEIFEYFAEKNLFENIFNKKYKVKQAHYLDRLEDFLSETVENPEVHIDQFGRGLLWRYYAKSSDSGTIMFNYLKTDDPLDPLSRTVKTFYTQLKSEQ